ncbi:MAG: hypothetical protein IJ174_09250, partial [Clostridia bacterium]|nr:hypothetical protein [Clostridia bacterium]
IVSGGLLGWLVGANAPRLRSAYGRAVLTAIVLLPAFIPATVWGALLSALPETFRRAAAGAIPVFSLTAAAGLIFDLRGIKRSGMAAVLLLALGAIFSTDAPIDLSASSANVTLHTLIASGLTKDSFAAAGFKMVVECVLSAILIVLILRLMPEPEELENFKPSRDARLGGTIALSFATVFLISCIVLIPLLINVFSGAFNAADLPSAVLTQSLLSALLTLVITFALSFGILFLSDEGGKAGRACILLAGTLLLSLTPIKKLIVQNALQGVFPTVFSAVLSPVPAMFTAFFLLLDTRNVRAHLLAASASALAAAGIAIGSAYPAIQYHSINIGALLESGASLSVYAILLPMLLLIGCVGAALASGTLSFTERVHAVHHAVLPKQGLTRSGKELVEPQALPGGARFAENASKDTRPSVFVPTIESRATDSMTSEERIHAHFVPAASSYTAQFLKSSEPDRTEPPALSKTLPLTDPVPEEPVNSGLSMWNAPTAAAPSPAPVNDPEPEFDPTAPSPAQLISLINALTRMRSLGIVSDREYREKRDALMKML